MDARISHIGRGRLPEKVPAIVQAVWRVRKVAGRAQKQIPVDTLRNRSLPHAPDAGARLRDDDLAAINLAQFAFPQDTHGRAGLRFAAQVQPGLHDPFVFPCGLDHAAAFDDGEGDRLLDIDVSARLASPNGHQSVPVIRRCDGDRVDVFPFQQAANIELGGGAVAGNFFYLRDSGREQTLIGITQSGHAYVGHLRKGAVMILAAAVKTHHCNIDGVVRAALRPSRPNRGCAGGESGFT